MERVLLVDFLDSASEAVERNLHALHHERVEVQVHAPRFVGGLAFRGWLREAYAHVPEDERLESPWDLLVLQHVVVSNIDQCTRGNASNFADPKLVKDQVVALKHALSTDITKYDALRADNPSVSIRTSSFRLFGQSSREGKQLDLK